MSYTRYGIGSIGLYLALAQAPTDISKATATTCLLVVAVVGILSFVSHVFLHKQDANRIGFKPGSASFQFEVGFANLAFGLTALASYWADWGLQANTVIILAYALYLLQSGLLHLYTATQNKKTRRTNVIRGSLTMVFSVSMLYIAHAAITSAQF